VAGPGVPASTIDQAVSLVDLAGTLVGLAHRPRPGSMHPESLLRAPISERDVYAETDYPRSAGWHALRVLVADRWKLIASSEPELYDLREDPGETRNVASGRSAGLAGIRARLHEIESAAGAAPRSSGTQV